MLILATIFSYTIQARNDLSFSGNSLSPIEISPEQSTGLHAIFVLDSTDGVNLSYHAQNRSVEWLAYDNLGGGFGKDLTPERNGDIYTIPLSGDMGYIISDGEIRVCFWVVDYSLHRLDLRALTVSSEPSCDRVALSFSGNAAPITYYSIVGAPRTISRELELSYTTLTFDAEQRIYSPKEETLTLASATSAIHVPDVYCDTRFSLSGDRFLSTWGMSQSIESDIYSPMAVTAETSAEMEEHTAENEQVVEGGALGGSAPVDITFTAVTTDAAIFTEWEIASDAEFMQIEDRFNQREFEYSFREAGTRYVRFNCADASGECTFTSETYEVNVGESALLCPNAFSPNGDGVNDEWRVSYKSIIDFDCYIFNRWGKELCHLTSPSQGWDGKTGGKNVPPGVYFYVIKATGSDGKNYNLSGHINIVGQGARLPGVPSDASEE